MSWQLLEGDGKPLAKFAKIYFERFDDLDPLELDIHVGVYAAYDQALRRPREFAPIVGRPDRKLSFRYRVMVDDAPLLFALEDPDAEPPDDAATQAEGGPTGHVRVRWAYDPDTYLPISSSEDVSVNYVIHFPNKGDAVHDDEAEFWRTNTMLSWNLTKLGEDLRQELYGGHLSDIKERPEGVWKKHEAEFLRSLARDFTYDDKGYYFEKWRGDHKPKPAQRYAELSDKYFARWFEETQLLEEKFHLWVTGADGEGGSMFQFELPKDWSTGKLQAIHVMGQTLPQLVSTQEKNIAARRKAEKEGKTPPKPLRAVFFYTRDGVKDRWKPRTPRVFSLDKDARASTQVVDPKELVKDANMGDQIASALGFGDDFDWFVELIAEKFPFRFYAFDLKAFDERWRNGVYPADSAPHPLREPLAQAAREALAKSTATGPIATRARAEAEKFLADTRYILFPQGLENGEGRKFLGFADSLAWARNVHTGHVEVMAQDDYVMALAKGKFWGDVAKSTAWIVPMATFMAYAAMFAVSFGTASGGMTAGQLTAQGVRQWAVRKVTNEGLKKAVWEAAKRVGPAFAALLAQGILSLFDDPKVKDTLADRWRMFAKGFFEGYVIQTVYDHLFKKITTTLLDGPKEYRTIVAVRRVWGVLDKVHGVFHRLDEELDEKAMQQAVQNFQHMATHIVRGCALIIASLYHVPHDQAAPALDLLGRGPDGAPPDQGQWEAEAGEAIAAIAKQLNEALQTAGSMEDAIDKVFTGAKATVIAGGLLYAFSGQITGGLTWVGKTSGKAAWKQIKKRKKLFLFTSIAAVGLLAGLKRDDIPGLIDDIGKLLKDLGEAALDFALGFPGRDEREAELYGKLVGNLIGGFVLDRELGELKKKIYVNYGGDTIHDKPVLSATFDNNFKHGLVMPIIKLLFRRYLSLYDRVSHNIKGMSKGEGELAAVFDDVQREQLRKRGLDPDHIQSFKSDHEKGMSLKSLGMAALKLQVVLEQDTQEFLKKKYAGNIQRYKDDLKAMADLSANLGITGLVEENLDMAWHHLATQLRLALSELNQGLRLMFSPFKPDGHFSWISLLQELGLDVGNMNLLRKELLDPRREELISMGLTPGKRGA